MQSSTPGPFGLGAQRQHASGKASMTLRDDGAGLGTVWIEALGQPDGGTITIQPDDAAPVRLATNATEATPLWQEVHAQHALTVSADGTGPVDLLSWSTAREQPGVTYSNLGTIGATVNLIGRWDPTLVASEIGRLKPALVLVAFGTNEGFRESLDTAAYQADFAERLQFLRAMAPDAGFLIVGPPDGSQHAPPGAPGACHDDPDWHVPPHLAEVREAQRTVARQQGIAFWDWSAAMGGRCSMARWARMDPPMSAGDHVHLLHAGYQATAETLFADIMRHYARYQGVPAAR